MLSTTDRTLNHWPKEIKNLPYYSLHYENSVRDKSHYIVINELSAVNNEEMSYVCD
jgi:hypothetical protein